MRVVGSSWKFYVYVYTAQDRISAKGKPLLGYSPSATLSYFVQLLFESESSRSQMFL